MKKRIALILALLLVLGMVGCRGSETAPEQPTDTLIPTATPEPTAFDLLEKLKKETIQYPSQNDQFKYTVYESYVEITEYTGGDDRVVIPDTIEDLPVKIIGGIKAKEIVLSENVLLIHFVNICKLHFIGNQKIFFDRGQLGNRDLHGTHGDISGSIETKDAEELLKRSYESGIPNGMFAYSEFTGAQEFHIPENITEIGKCAFCNSIMPEFVDCGNVKAIGDYAFEGVENLRTIDFQFVEEIGENPIIGKKRRSGSGFDDPVICDVYFRNLDVSFKGFFHHLNVSYTEKVLTVHGYAGSTAAEFATSVNAKFEVIK